MRLLGKALTFDDVLLVPAFSQVLPKDASLSTQFSRNIRLNLPLVSAAMDTVTEARLAIAIAQEGGIGAMQQGSADRYFQESSTGNPNADKLVPEGIEGRVPFKGSMVAIIYQMAGGLRASMGYCGCATIDDMQNKAEFVEITSAGIRESHVHDVQITKEAPNYRAD